MSDVYGIGGVAQAAGSVAVAAIQAAVAYQQIKVANRAEDRLTKAADEALSWSKLLHARYEQKYLPCEDAWLEKACSATPYVPKYDSVINRVQASVRSSFTQARTQIRNRQSVYCVGVTCAQERQISLAEAAAMADAQNAAIRIEDARKDAYEERDYTRIANAVNVGRLFAADARASADTSARLWTQIAQAAGQSAAGSLQGLGASLRQLTGPTRNTIPGQSQRPVNALDSPSGNFADIYPEDPYSPQPTSEQNQQAVMQSLGLTPNTQDDAGM
jgi:hypothetical protein